MVDARSSRIGLGHGDADNSCKDRGNGHSERSSGQGRKGD